MTSANTAINKQEKLQDN